jgi:hypothetical protein
VAATAKRTLAAVTEIRVVLKDGFLIRLPENPKLDERLN